MSRVLLDHPYICPLCQRRVRQLYPLTRHNPQTGHWENVKACLPCCGPSGDETPPAYGAFSSKPIQR